MTIIDETAAVAGTAPPHTVCRPKPNCSQLFLVYQGRAGKLFMPPLTFIRVTQIHDRNMILFRDASQADYQRGISSDISSMSAFVDWQRNLIASDFPNTKTLYCVGTSAGAYAALASGFFLRASVVWAFAPLTEITEVYEGSALPDDAISLRCRDLQALLREGNGVTEYRVFYNEHYETDRKAAERLEKCPGVTLFPQPGEDHPVVLTMDQLGRLRGLLVPFEPV
jgi:hypothetical protein